VADDPLSKNPGEPFMPVSFSYHAALVAAFIILNLSLRLDAGRGKY